MANKIDKDNIPLYNDEKINREIEQRKRVEENEKRKKEAEKLKEEKRALKLSRFHISEIPTTMLLCIYFMIATIGISIYMGKYQYVLFSVIGIPATIYTGKRLRFTFDDALNVLVWNMTYVINEFINYKIRFDLYTGNGKRIKTLSVILAIIVATLSSNTIFFGLLFVITILFYLVSFADRDLASISNASNIVVIGGVIGLVSKTLLYTFLTKNLYIDFMNIIIICVFTAISHYTKNLPITEPMA